METDFTDTLRLAREQANRQVTSPRERAIIIRCIEDALCRAHAGGHLPDLPLPGPRKVEGLGTEGLG